MSTLMLDRMRAPGDVLAFLEEAQKQVLRADDTASHLAGLVPCRKRTRFAFSVNFSNIDALPGHAEARDGWDRLGPI